MKVLFISIAFIGSLTALGQTKAIFNKDKPFEVISAKQGITSQSSSTDTSQCKKWTIPQNDLPKVIKGCKSISGEDWHHLFDVWPCIIQGQLKQEGQSYKFEINGGSWMYIYCQDSTLLLGNFQNRMKNILSQTHGTGNKKTLYNYNVWEFPNYFRTTFQIFRHFIQNEAIPSTLGYILRSLGTRTTKGTSIAVR